MGLQGENGVPSLTREPRRWRIVLQGITDGNVVEASVEAQGLSLLEARQIMADLAKSPLQTGAKRRIATPGDPAR